MNINMLHIVSKLISWLRSKPPEKVPIKQLLKFSKQTLAPAAQAIGCRQAGGIRIPDTSALQAPERVLTRAPALRREDRESERLAEITVAGLPIA